MAGIFNVGGPQYDVDDVKIARNNGDGTFGTWIDVPSCDLFVATVRLKSAEMRGDARITAIASAAEAAEVQVRMGSFSFDAYEVIFGSTVSESGSGSGEKIEMSIGATQRMPYFGVIARSLAGESDGGTLIFLPYLKIMQPLGLRVEYNTFSMPEVNALALGDPTLVDGAGRPLLMKVKGYATLPTVTYPLP